VLATGTVANGPPSTQFCPSPWPKALATPLRGEPATTALISRMRARQGKKRKVRSIWRNKNYYCEHCRWTGCVLYSFTPKRKSL